MFARMLQGRNRMADSLVALGGSLCFGMQTQFGVAALGAAAAEEGTHTVLDHRQVVRIDSFAIAAEQRSRQRTDLAQRQKHNYNHNFRTVAVAAAGHKVQKTARWA